MRALEWIACAPIRFYQYVLSPFWPGVCRFQPSCSAYALGAIRRFGVLAGVWLAVRRIFRCHPWGETGDDPVPDDWRQPSICTRPYAPGHQLTTSDRPAQTVAGLRQGATHDR